MQEAEARAADKVSGRFFSDCDSETTVPSTVLRLGRAAQAAHHEVYGLPIGKDFLGFCHAPFIPWRILALVACTTSENVLGQSWTLPQTSTRVGKANELLRRYRTRVPLSLSRAISLHQTCDATHDCLAANRQSGCNKGLRVSHRGPSQCGADGEPFDQLELFAGRR